MATEYAAQAFDPDIGQLRGMLSQMGGLAERAIHDAINALQRADTALATQIRESDNQIGKAVIDSNHVRHAWIWRRPRGRMEKWWSETIGHGGQNVVVDEKVE